MPGREYSTESKYRYGFNGKENDNDVKGQGNQQDYGMRIYDPRLGKFLSIDPLTKSYPYYTPYSFAANKPIWCIDRDGCEDSTANTLWARDQINEGNDPLKGVVFDINLYNPVVTGIAVGLGKTAKRLGDFVIRDAWKGKTWKNVGAFLEEAVFDMSSVKISESPDIDAIAKNFQDKVINGDTYSITEYFTELGAEILTSYLLTEGAATVTNTIKVAARTRLAASAYAKAGFDVDRAVAHMRGINFANPVQKIMLKAGSVVQQWVGKGGIGNYFTPLENGAAKNLGVSVEGRTLQQFTLTEDVQVLKSTAATLNGSPGGGIQYFSTDLKNKIIPLKSP